MTRAEQVILFIMVIAFIVANLIISIGAIVTIIDKRGYFLKKKPEKKESTKKSSSDGHSNLVRYVNIFVANGPMYKTDLDLEKSKFFADYQKKYNTPYAPSGEHDMIELNFNTARYESFCSACQVGMKVEAFKTEIEILDWLRDNIFNAEIFIINPTGLDQSAVNNLITNISNFLDSRQCTATKKVYIIAENSYKYRINDHIRIYVRTEDVNTIATIIGAAKFAFEELVTDIVNNIKNYGNMNGYILHRTVKG